MTEPTVAVIGGGPGGLMVAERLLHRDLSVTVYDRMRTPGRKFLVAGRGGLNLTHREPIDELLNRYGPARAALEASIRSFGPDEVRAWAHGLGQATFVGTSRRVFPERMLAAPMLLAWMDRLTALGAAFRFGHRWNGWDDDGRAVFNDPAGATVPDRSAATVLAVGGASWPRTGSDGSWVGPVERAGIQVTPLRPSNCGVLIDWTATFRERFNGAPVKNVEVRHGAVRHRGEMLVTSAGLEGGAVYAVSALVRAALDAYGSTTLEVDLRPDLSRDELARRLAGRRSKESTATALRRAGGLSHVAIGLLREATSNRLPRDPVILADLVRATPLRVTGSQGLESAISTAGGISFDEVDERFMLRRRPGVFVAGEMLDWEAPTGGYLLQATFSTAVAAADGVIHWLNTER